MESKVVETATQRDMLATLTIWVDEHRRAWAYKGVGVIERDGTTLWPNISAAPRLPSQRSLFIGPVAQCRAHRESPYDFVRVDVDEQMGLEHCQILIENAVDQVAGR